MRQSSAGEGIEGEVCAGGSRLVSDAGDGGLTTASIDAGDHLHPPREGLS